MVESETDIAWEDSKVSLTEAEKKQKNKDFVNQFGYLKNNSYDK